MSAAAQYAQKALAAVHNELTPEQARALYLAVSGLVVFARSAEHAALMLLSELEAGHKVSAADFNTAARQHLGEVRDQLKFVSKVLNDSQSNNNGGGA